MKHTISVLVENHFGVLARISSLFSGRGFNIDSLSVGETENPEISRMTIVVKGDDQVLEQVTKQLNKQIDIIKVIDLCQTPHITRELVMIKLAAEGPARSEVIEIADLFRAKIVDVARKSLTIEATGSEEKITAMINLLRKFGIKEIVRTGIVAIARAPVT